MTKDTKFKSGISGNPKGRPKGIKDKRTAYRELLQPHAEDLITKAVELAQAGDTIALRMCLDRLIAPIKAKDSTIMIEDLKGSLAEQGQKVILAMCNSEVTPDDAGKVLQALAAQSRILEIDNLDKRVAKLEENRL